MQRQLAIVGWGLFCASSWTWCIGMYLPVLLLRHFGWPGVLAFAVPNVAGCVAFGYVLRAHGNGRRILLGHSGACAAFSLVTVAFHLFFAAFVVAYLVRPTSFLVPIAVLAAIGLYVVGIGFSRIPDRAWPAAAAVVYGISLLVLLRLGLEPLAGIVWHGDLDGWRLAPLAPTLAFGFLLCPYLDWTFHRALAESPSRHAFAVFGAAFSVMILLTCVYWDALAVGLPTVVVVHLIAQSAFTVAAHLRELRTVPLLAAPAVSEGATVGQANRGTPAPSKLRGLLWALPLAGIPVALFPLAGPAAPQAAEGMYLRFLVFYGLVFPLYVLLFVSPWAVWEPTRRSLLPFTGCVLLAAPFYEIGFLHEITWLLLIPLAVIGGGLGARRLALRRGRAASPRPPTPRTASLVD